MRYLILLLFSTLLPLSLCAKGPKAPKFFKKARLTQLTILAYDSEGNIEQGQGYFLNEQNDVVLDYTILKKAVKVKAVDANGQEYELTRIKGANSLYNIAKLSSTGLKKPFSMPILTDAIAIGTAVYVMPLCNTDKDATCIIDTVAKVETFEDGHNYYTLTSVLDERLSGAPVFTEQGELIGSVQLSADKEKQHGYVLAASYAQKLAINAVDANKYDIRALPMPKALPQDENEATTFLYLTNKQDTISYRANLQDFISAFPESNTGYIQMAEFEAQHGHYEQAEKVYAEGLTHCKEHLDEIHHSFAKLLYQSGLRNTPLTETWTLDKAITEANAAYEAQPQPLYLALQGMILYGQKNYAEAYDKFMKMGETNMRSADYFLYAAQCKQMMKAPAEEILAVQDSALACFNKPYPIEAANSLYLRSKTLAELKRYREAVADLNEYEHILSARVSDQFYYEREQLEMQCRMYQQALNDIDRAISIQPQEPLYRAEQAAVNYRVGQIDEALAAAREAVKLDDSFADAHRILGICLSEKGKKQEARAAIQKAIDLGDELAKTIIEKLQ